MKVAVLGSNGQLGSDLQKELTDKGCDAVPLTHKDINVEDYESVSEILRSLKPDVIVNTAAYHVVPQCESDPLRAYQVNSLGALHVAKVGNALGARVVYYSTDYVFDGLKGCPYVETDLPHPLNIYASTKLLGEFYTLNHAAESMVLRVSGLYGRIPCRAKGGNFITTMIKAAKQKPVVKVVRDEILTPTSTSAIARSTYDLIANNGRGLFHLTCEGDCSWYDFARVIFDTLHITTPLESCSVNDLPSTVRRPLYSVLENERLKGLQLRTLPHWKDALVEFLRENFA
jgi:dTDP-4-dehydrorhamnose reductase